MSELDKQNCFTFAIKIADKKYSVFMGLLPLVFIIIELIKLNADIEGTSSDIVEGIKLHHEDNLTLANPLTICLSAGNALSSARPGARKEVLETYIKRLDDMEDIVKAFDGIEEAFVLQAGREVRALVSPDGLSDEEIIDISNNIASKLRSELTFPGQVRISVLRESKYVDYAK